MIVQPDIEKYRPFVERFDLDEAQKEELIHTVWVIMESFVDRAFGLDPVQQSAPALRGPDSQGTSVDLGSKGNRLTSRFQQQAGPTGSEKR